MKQSNKLAAGFAALILLSSCKHLQAPQEAYVKADRARFEMLEPMVRALADEDPLNDPDLSGVNGRSVLAMLEAWDLQIRTAEGSDK